MSENRKHNWKYLTPADKGQHLKANSKYFISFFVIPRFFTGNIELNFVSWCITLHEEPFFCDCYNQIIFFKVTESLSFQTFYCRNILFSPVIFSVLECLAKGTSGKNCSISGDFANYVVSILPPDNIFLF